MVHGQKKGWVIGNAAKTAPSYPLPEELAILSQALMDFPVSI